MKPRRIGTGWALILPLKMSMGGKKHWGLARRGAIAGGLLALGAPLGWALLTQYFGPAQDPARLHFETVLWAYLTLPSLIVLPVFGWYLGKHAERLEQSLHKLSQEHREFERMSRTDHDTGLFNERGFTELITHWAAQSRRNGVPLSVVVWDLDPYHSLTAHYGRVCARDALLHVTTLLTNTERTDDLVARTGTETFAALLPNTDLAGARVVAERLIHEIHASAFRFEGQRHVLSLSAGYTEIEPSDDARRLLSRAEVGLHQARRMGGNLAVASGSAVHTLPKAAHGHTHS